MMVQITSAEGKVLDELTAILEHLGLPTRAPPLASARDPGWSEAAWRPPGTPSRRPTAGTVSHRTSGGTTILHDGASSFEEQSHHPITPVPVRRGEPIEVTCTWVNTGPDEVRHGDGSLDEMCFAGIYRYPAAHEGLFCAAGP